MEDQGYMITEEMRIAQNKFDEIYFKEIENKEFGFEKSIEFFKNILKNEDKRTAVLIIRAVNTDSKIYSSERKKVQKKATSELYEYLKIIRKQHMQKQKFLKRRK